MSENYEDTIKALEDEHNELVTVVVDKVLYAFRKPTDDEFEGFQEKYSGDKKGARKGVAFRQLCMQTCVHGRDTLELMFAERPAVATKLCDPLCDLAGADIEIKIKKG